MHVIRNHIITCVGSLPLAHVWLTLKISNLNGEKEDFVDSITEK